MLNKNPVFVLIFIIFVTVFIFPQENSEEKPIVAILDLNAIEVSDAETLAVTNLLISVIHGTDLVQIIDRNQREEILNEISFSLSGCADDSCALEIGKMLAADLLITGSLSKVGSRISIELKALSVEEGSILETTFKLFDSIDEVVDNIDSVGATLIQNVTGKRAAQREILQYEDLVTLTVTSDVEDASVIVNDTPVGRIENGQVTKALNKNIDAVISIEHPRYYPAQKEIYLDSDRSIDISMEPYFPVSNAIKLSCGGGSMGALYYRFYPIPTYLFLDFGLAATMQSTSLFYLQTLFQFKAGWYFTNENNFLRPYAGLSLMFPIIEIINSPAGSFIDSNDEVFTDGTIDIMPDMDRQNADFDYGFLLGLDFAVTKTFYLGIEADLFLNTGNQNDDGPMLNTDGTESINGLGFIELFNFATFDPMMQFGVNATFMFEPPYLSTNKNSVKVEGSNLEWKEQEYLPELFTEYTKFLSDLNAEPGLSEQVRKEIENYHFTRTMMFVGAGITGATTIGLGVWAISDLFLNLAENDLAIIGAVGAGWGTAVILLALQAALVPVNVISAYNESLEAVK